MAWTAGMSSWRMRSMATRGTTCMTLTADG
jgi:hypothetical protein